MSAGAPPHGTTDAALQAAATVDPSRGRGLQKVALALLALGVLCCAIGYALDAEGRSRLAFGYLLAFVFTWTIVLGSVFFIALQHITSSVWSVVMRRVAEMLASPMWWVALLFVPVLLLALIPGASSMFPWSNPDIVAQDHGLEMKAPYLNVPFFVVRTVVFFLLWGAFAAFFVKTSLKQDDGQVGADGTARMKRLAAPFIILFGLTVTFAAIDWLMSLEPHWFSTIFGVYVFSGMTLAALAALTLAVVWMRARGWLAEDLITRDHLYSLGALLFAFTCFWAYIAFSQFMLIWYANLPEETFWFRHRFDGGWMAVSWLLVFLRFVIPFFLLLGRSSKMDPKRLAAASVLILGGQLVDLYWLIMPQAHGAAPRLGWQELGPSLLLTGLLALFVARFLGRRRLVAVGDPLLEKSRHFHL